VNLITRSFLRAKHWQIFLLFVGFTILANIATAISIMKTAPSPEGFERMEPLFGTVMALFMFCFQGWFWSMGSFLNTLVPPTLKLKANFFRFALVYPAVYIFVFLAFFAITTPGVLAIILPLHFVAMFCMFYNLYFVSKTLVLAETRKQASFYEYAGPLFLIWFFPVGVWFVQPRINRLYAQSTLAPTPVEPGNAPSLARAPASVQGGDAQGLSPEAPFVYAGFWLRMAAALVDGLVLFIPFCVITMVVIVVFKLLGASKGDDGIFLIATAWPLATILMTSFYFALMERSPWQATLGKLAVGLRVSDIEGHRLTLGRAMGRTLAKYISLMTIGIGYVMCGFTEKKQTLHDMIAKCLVLRRPR
jgi:uncharacterized RDD family membrane protein YckC